tara:strand:- start:40484 stop:41974 length:1491 start_codon:yes stop_codon:yes gene_type:complete
MAKQTSSSKNISSINVRMYRGGTGDFFILQFKIDEKVSFQLMIDCGCIHGSKAYFKERVEDLKTYTGGTIDLLVVTHEHADHINGFQKAAAIFKQITFKKVWFAWTEDEDNPLANDFRKNRSELDKALKIAVSKLEGLMNQNYYETLYANEHNGEAIFKGKKHFVESLDAIDALNEVGRLHLKTGKPKPTMVTLLKEFNVIKEGTEVEFLEPGEVKIDIPGAPGIRFYVLGPPKDAKYLNRTDGEDGNYEKREEKSNVDFALVSALAAFDASDNSNILPFDSTYEKGMESESLSIKKTYDIGGDWRKIDHDWLYSSGGLAMRYETSINNTSLALAIQFEKSEKVLLFPGDAEFGNWDSWHDGLEWPVIIDGITEQKNAEYLLNNTVFYKVGHHLSQNGTAKGKGIEMMTSNDLTAFGTLDFRKINSGWLNTMPNDLLCSELIHRTKGKFYLEGEWPKILKNIKTDRVTIKRAHETTLIDVNKPFDGKLFIQCEIAG